MAVNPRPHSSIICSLCEGKYAFGLASLINSCIANGFKGLFYVAVRNELPFWINKFKKQNNEFIINENCAIKFEQVSWEYHLSYYKPFLIKKILENNLNSAVFYFDPDITLECDWRFFEDWVEIGVTLCTDGNYPILGKKHPWVMAWKSFFDIDEIKAEGDMVPYVNSGFIGLKASQLDIIKTWIKFTDLLISKGHNLNSFGPTLNWYKQKRAFSVCGDQDILNAVLTSQNFDVSLIGLEGMGFNGSSYLMFHNIGKKTWDKNFIKEFLKNGNKISMADDSYLKYSEGIINPYNSLQLFALKINIKITKLLQRVL